MDFNPNNQPDNGQQNDFIDDYNQPVDFQPSYDQPLNYQQTPQPEPPKKKPFYKRKGFIIGISIFLVLGLLGGLMDGFSTTSDVVELQEQVDELNATIDELNQQIKDKDDQISNLENQISSLESEINKNTSTPVEQPATSSTSSSSNDKVPSGAFAAVQMYGEKVYPYGFDFNMFDIITEEKRGDNEYFIKGYAKITNALGQKGKYEIEAVVVGEGIRGETYEITHFYVYE